MLMSLHKIICFIGICLTLVCFFAACNSQSKLMKQADIQNNAGMFEDAANLYYNILLQDAKNKDAKSGLQINGQKVIADKFAKFSKFVIEDRIEEALKTYRYAQGYAKNAEKVGVKLNWPNEYDEVYDDIKQEYILTKYDLAIGQMLSRKYEAAERIFEQMAVYDSSYAQVSVLRLNTVLEPMYQQALKHFQAKKFKDAYYLFNKINDIDDGYKDAKKLRDQSLQQATQIIGVLPIYNKSDNNKAITTLPDQVADLLNKIQGAYVKVANVQALHKDIQSRGFNNITNYAEALETGKNLNLGYAVFIVIDSFSFVKQKPIKLNRDAYEVVTENILNPYTKTYQSISKFKKATYVDNTESQEVRISASYQLIHTSTGEVIAQNLMSVVKFDEFHQAVYAGNPANLFPTLPDGNYLPQVSQEWRDMFSNSKRTLKEQNEFIQLALGEIASKMSADMINKLAK